MYIIIIKTYILLGDNMNNRYVKEKLVLKKTIRNKLYKLCFTTIVFLLGMISTKLHPTLKETINKKVYTENISLASNRNNYKKLFSSMFAEKKDEQVISNKLDYKKETKYKDGVILTVENNYPVPVLENGLIIYKDNEKIIVEQIDGVKASYGKLKNDNSKLYDYLEKGDIIGTTIKEELYLTLEKEGEYIDYKKYI